MASDNTLNFLDLACVLKITPDMTMEKLGSAINAGVFDAANIAGTLKIKGLINFAAQLPGSTNIELTDKCKALLDDANAKSAEPTDALDDEILRQLSGGKRIPIDLQNTLNINSKDLALRLYKLYKQNFISYELRNGNVDILLTESGFLKSKEPKPQQTQMLPEQQTAQPAGQQAAQAMPESGALTAEDENAEKELAGEPSGQVLAKKGNGAVIVISLVVIIVAILILIMLNVI